jgi:hypothetical protein
MSRRGEPAADEGSGDVQAGRRGKKETAFRRHLTIYLVTGLFLFTLNLLTSPGELWFYWPLFFWGWAIIFQAVATFGADAPSRVVDTLRSIVPGFPERIRVPDPAERPASGGSPFAATAFASVHANLEHLRDITGQIPDGAARDQARRISDAADRIVAVMAADRASAEMVTWFDTQLLEPAASLLERYVRLSTRGVSDAEETLRRVEERNLPQLESRFEALYTQLHRGEIIDLAVASEMLDMDPPQLPPPSRISGAETKQKAQAWN